MSRRGWVLFAAMGVIWGLPYLMIKVADTGVSTPVLVCVRTAVGALMLLPLALRDFPVRRLLRHWRPLLAFAVLEMIGPWWLLSDAERRLPSALTALLIAAVPIITVLPARIAGDQDRLSPIRWLGLLVGFAGVALLAGGHVHGGDAWAIAEVLLTAVGYATAPVIAAHTLNDVPGPPLITSCLALAAIGYAPAAILTRPRALPAPNVLAALGGLAVVCTALAFVLFFALIREVGSSRAMVFTYLNPVIAVVAGVLVLHEPVTVTIILAFGLVLAGSVLATRRGVEQPIIPAPDVETQPETSSRHGDRR